MSDKTIRELQSGLPWTTHYHRDFRGSPMTCPACGQVVR